MNTGIIIFVRSFNTQYQGKAAMFLGQVPCGHSMFRNCVKRNEIVPQSISSYEKKKTDFLGIRWLDANHVPSYVSMGFF